MSSLSQKKWNKIYSDSERQSAAQPSAVVERYKHSLPKQGCALDYACGRGGNALLFAEAGLQVQAWDVSDVALSQLQSTATSKQLKLQTRAVDLTTYAIGTDCFDVISCSYYLDRQQMSALSAALKPGGFLFYETFNGGVPSGSGPSNPDYLLRPAELLQHFGDLQLLFYEELWDVQDAQSETGVSRLLARRPSLS